MVSGAFAAVFGADCGKRQPTQVDWVAPLRPVYRSPPLWTTKTQKNPRQSCCTGSICLYTRRTSVFGALAAVFGEYCGENAPDTAVLFF